jgi:glycosyltransferase involved in cell wall biosynthesis
VLVVGPGLAQVGGLATFVDILLSSPYMRERYELIHLDTTRGPQGSGLVCTFALVNVAYLIRQAARFVWLEARFRPRLLHVPITSFISFWKEAVFILMGRAFSMRIIAHLHGGMFGQFYERSAPAIRWLIRWVLHRADVVVALSTGWKRLLLERISPDLVVEVVPNSVDASFARAARGEGVMPARGQAQVLFVGAVEQHKGVFDILKAVPLVSRAHPDVCFILAGPEGPKAEQLQIARLCSEANLDGAVRFPGVVTGRDKLDLFLSSTLFVLPSYVENLPMVVLEAMAAGLPVIATPVGAVPELVRDDVNGYLVQPGDYQALAERIVHLLENAPLRAEMARANRQSIQRDYLPEIAMSRFDRIYNRLLNAHQL